MRKVEKKTAYHLQVYDILKQQILSGDLAPGEKINEYKERIEHGDNKKEKSQNLESQLREEGVRGAL